VFEDRPRVRIMTRRVLRDILGRYEANGGDAIEPDALQVILCRVGFDDED
jgi:hypothetical protein